MYAVKMSNIYKSYGGVHALSGVSFNLKQGEVHAILGENGAGKSTLIKVLSGAVTRDSGEIQINGEPAKIFGTHAAIKKGISVIYQEISLVSDLSVAENLFLGDIVSMNHPVLNRKVLNDRTKKVFEQINFTGIKPDTLVKDLSIAYQQMLEVAKAIAHSADIIVFDEPTAVLSSTESEKLFEVIANLKAQKKSIIYISHRLQEVFRIADRLTIMKDGTVVGTYDKDDMNEAKAIELMIGRKLSDMFPKRTPKIRGTALKVENLNCGKKVNNVSFELKHGEILGFSGMVGAGKTETMRAIFGADRIQSGNIYIDGKKAYIKNPKQAKKKGIAYISENRKEEGIILDMSIKHNITMADIATYTAGGWILGSKEKSKVDTMIKKLAIKTPTRENKAGSLSGGNQQKVSLAKWLVFDNDVIIFDEPTRGVDVGAKSEIYRLIAELANNDCAIIIVSSDMMEIIGMSDRVITMHEGKISGELKSSEITEQNIIAHALAIDIK